MATSRDLGIASLCVLDDTNVLSMCSAHATQKAGPSRFNKQLHRQAFEPSQNGEIARLDAS